MATGSPDDDVPTRPDRCHASGGRGYAAYPLPNTAANRADMHSDVSKNKFTVAEFDEEEHNLDRLRRWFRELRARDIFTVAEGAHADEQLKVCTDLLDQYADEVYRAVRAPLETEES